MLAKSFSRGSCPQDNVVGFRLRSCLYVSLFVFFVFVVFFCLFVFVCVCLCAYFLRILGFEDSGFVSCCWILGALGI